MSPRGETYQELKYPDGDERDPIQQPGFQDVPLNFRITSFCMFRLALESQHIRKRGQGEGATALPCYQPHRVVPPERVNEPGLGPIQVEQKRFCQGDENWVARP